MTVSSIEGRRGAPKGRPTGGNGNGGNGLVGHRLSDLERRMETLESSVKTVSDTVIRIEAKMDGLASKTYVLTIFGITGGLAVLTFIGHIILRAIGN